MLSATLYGDCVHIKILNEQGPASKSMRNTRFFQDLKRITDDIPSYDRYYDPEHKTWLIKHPERYSHVSYIANAVRSGRMQPELF
jgi:hypothetical protein